MTKQSILNQLETIIGKLVHLNYHIEGNQLQDATREVAHVRDRMQRGDMEVKKFPKAKKKPVS